MVDASYYNLYQPTPYSSYYSNLYNYQQYQVNGHTPHRLSKGQLNWSVRFFIINIFIAIIKRPDICLAISAQNFV